MKIIKCALQLKEERLKEENYTINNIIVVFFFSYFIQLCDSRKFHNLTREFRVKLPLKNDIALIASRFVRYRFSRAI